MKVVNTQNAERHKGQGRLKAFAITALVMLAFSNIQLRSQELEYAMEIGGMAGGSFYLGDANYSGLYKNLCATAGAFARWNINPRMAAKFNLSYAGIRGDLKNSDNKYPQLPQGYSFSESVVDVGCQYELHFWGFGTGTASYKGNKRWTPYIQFGIGGTYCAKTFTMNIPVGFGIKYKVKDRLNVGLDWSMRFSLSDKLDGIEDPYKIKSGFLKNKDSYCMTSIYVAYDFCAKLKKCPSNM